MKVVFAGTRQVYGRPDSLPVNEHHLVRPTDVNGINKAAGEYYHLVYNNVFGVRACSLRLTNVYGPRQLIKHNRQGFIGWFIRLAIEDRTIQIYGDGSQLRDFVYVDDAADAFLRAGASDACNGEVFNVGGDEPISHRELTTLLIDVAGSGRVEYVEWPAEKKAIDIGSFYADSTQVQAARPAGRRRSACARGCARTLAFYREHFDRYVDAAEPARRSACDATRAHSLHVAGAAATMRPTVRAAIDRVDRERLVRPRPRGRGVRGGVRRRVGRRARRRRRAPAPTRSR